MPWVAWTAVEALAHIPGGWRHAEQERAEGATRDALVDEAELFLAVRQAEVAVDGVGAKHKQRELAQATLPEGSSSLAHCTRLEALCSRLDLHRHRSAAELPVGAKPR